MLVEFVENPTKKRKKRKLSAYNRHVRKEMKAGKTMKQAARSWKGVGGAKKKTSSRKKSGVRKTSARNVDRLGRYRSRDTRKRDRFGRFLPGKTGAAGFPSVRTSPRGRFLHSNTFEMKGMPSKDTIMEIAMLGLGMIIGDKGIEQVEKLLVDNDKSDYVQYSGVAVAALTAFIIDRIPPQYRNIALGVAANAAKRAFSDLRAKFEITGVPGLYDYRRQAFNRANMYPRALGRG